MFVSLVPKLGALLAQHGAAIAAGVLTGAVAGGAGVATGIIPVGGSPQAAGNVAVLACPGSGSVLTRISSGQTLLITARSADGHWLQVYVGQPGIGRGWAPASALRAQAAVDGLPVADCGATALGPPPTTTPGASLAPSASIQATVLPTLSAAPGSSTVPTVKPSSKPTPTPKPHKYFARACGNFDGAGGCTPGGADAMISELIDTNDSGVPDAGDTVKLTRYPTTFGDSAAGWGTFGGTTTIGITSVVLASDNIKVLGVDGRGYAWGQNTNKEFFGVYAGIGSGAAVYWEAVDAFNSANADVIDAESGNPLGVPPMYLDRAGATHDHFITVTLRLGTPAPTPVPTTYKDPNPPVVSGLIASDHCLPSGFADYLTVTVTDADDADTALTVALKLDPVGLAPYDGETFSSNGGGSWEGYFQPIAGWTSGYVGWTVIATDASGNKTSVASSTNNTAASYVWYDTGGCPTPGP